VAADEVDTGIGPVLTLEDFRVRWTFIGFSELRFKEDEEEGVAGDGVKEGRE
jgi:hypothetical protein